LLPFSLKLGFDERFPSKGEDPGARRYAKKTAERLLEG